MVVLNGREHKSRHCIENWLESIQKVPGNADESADAVVQPWQNLYEVAKDSRTGWLTERRKLRIWRRAVKQLETVVEMLPDVSWVCLRRQQKLIVEVESATKTSNCSAVVEQKTKIE